MKSDVCLQLHFLLFHHFAQNIGNAEHECRTGVWFSGWDDELRRGLFPPNSLRMLQDTDKLVLFDSGAQLKVALPLPVPTRDASGLSPPVEQGGVAVLPDQPALRLTESMLRQDYTWGSLVPALPLLRLSLPGELLPPQAPTPRSLLWPGQQW